MDTLLDDAAHTLFADLCTDDAVRAIEAGGSANAMAQAIAASGFAHALVSESRDGAGLGLTQAFGLLFAAGQHVVPVPVVASVLARAWLDARDVPLAEGLVALAPVGVHRRASGWQAARVALGAQAQQVLLAVDGEAWLLPASAAVLTPDGVAGSLVTAMQWDASVAARSLGSADGLHALAAAGQTALLAGAADRVLAMSVQYAQERAQFGRSIGKFQAIQHQLAVLAEHAAVMRMAAQIACTADPGQAPRAAAVQAGMAVCCERAGEVAAIGHAVHGAIGVTAEHRLQRFTRRLHQWSTDLGAASYWARRLGESALASEASALDVIRVDIQADAALA